MSDTPAAGDTPPAEPTPTLLPPQRCRFCNRKDAVPGSMFCDICTARRQAAQAALAKTAAPPPPAAKLVQKATAPARPRAVVPQLNPDGTPHTCNQCLREYGQPPDPDDKPTRCGSCTRKNKEQLRNFTRGQR